MGYGYREKWEEGADFGFDGLAAVFGDLEGFGVFYVGRLRGVALFQGLAPFWLESPCWQAPVG